MRYKAALGTGFATGYVLGAKAGRQRYEAIMKVVRDFMEKPAVQQTAGVVQAQAADLAGSAKKVVTDKVGGRMGGSDPDPGATMDPPGYVPPPTPPITTKGVAGGTMTTGGASAGGATTDGDPARH